MGDTEELYHRLRTTMETFSGEWYSDGKIGDLINAFEMNGLKITPEPEG